MRIPLFIPTVALSLACIGLLCGLSIAIIRAFEGGDPWYLVIFTVIITLASFPVVQLFKTYKRIAP
jgi:hypothetical protein